MVFWVYLVIDKKAIVQPTASRSSIWLCWSKCANLPRNTINRSTHSRFAFLWDFDYGFAFHLIARKKKEYGFCKCMCAKYPRKTPFRDKQWNKNQLINKEIRHKYAYVQRERKRERAKDMQKKKPYQQLRSSHKAPEQKVWIDKLFFVLESPK